MKLKIIFVFFLGILVLGACNNATNKVNGNAQKVLNANSSANTNVNKEVPVLIFDETVHDFGSMIQGEIVKNSFHFKNVGNADLKISGVRTSCGCTVGKYPHQAVKPGGQGDIEVTFNSTHKMGFQNKSIMILSNTQPNSIVLRIKAMVSAPKLKTSIKGNLKDAI